MRIGDRNLRSLEQILLAKVNTKYDWVKHIHMQHKVEYGDPYTKYKKTPKNGMIHYIVEFEDNSTPIWDEQSEVFHLISKFHSTMAFNTYYTTTSMSNNHSSGSFPYSSTITESEDNVVIAEALFSSSKKLEKYYNYIADDIVDNMKFNDPIFGHMAEIFGNEVNTCNLYSSIVGIIQNYYGARRIEVLEVVVKVNERLDNIYPHRCNPYYRG